MFCMKPKLCDHSPKPIWYMTTLVLCGALEVWYNDFMSTMLHVEADTGSYRFWPSNINQTIILYKYSYMDT